MSEAHAHHAGDDHAEMGHVMPISILLAVFVALIVLTIATVVANDFDLGPAEILVSMGIATIKAGLVMAYFMHLRYDKLFNTFAFCCSLVFLALFVSFALLDTKAYQGDIKSYRLSPYGQPVAAPASLPAGPAATPTPAAAAPAAHPAPAAGVPTPAK